MTTGWVGYGGYAKCSACGVTHREAKLRDGKCINVRRCELGFLGRPLGGPVWPGKPPDPTDPGPNDPPALLPAPPGDEVGETVVEDGLAENVEGRAVSGDLAGIPGKEKSG